MTWRVLQDINKNILGNSDGIFLIKNSHWKFRVHKHVISLEWETRELFFSKSCPWNQNPALETKILPLNLFTPSRLVRSCYQPSLLMTPLCCFFGSFRRGWWMILFHCLWVHPLEVHSDGLGNSLKLPFEAIGGENGGQNPNHHEGGCKPTSIFFGCCCCCCCCCCCWVSFLFFFDSWDLWSDKLSCEFLRKYTPWN